MRSQITCTREKYVCTILFINLKINGEVTNSSSSSQYVRHNFTNSNFCYTYQSLINRCHVPGISRGWQNEYSKVQFEHVNTPNHLENWRRLGDNIKAYLQHCVRWAGFMWLRTSTRPMSGTHEKPMQFTEEYAGCVPEPVWTIWRRQKCLSTARIPTPGRPAHIQVAIQTTLSRLQRRGIS